MGGGGDFSCLGELVLLIGDLLIPQRAAALPPCFRELLKTDKIQQVLCTGNLGSREALEVLRAISPNVHCVKGDCDGELGADFPETFVRQIGDFRVGLIHGHQVAPWHDTGALVQIQRKLACDILVYGHSSQNSVKEIDGHFFISPGSATGAYQPWVGGQPGEEASSKAAFPSFMLMAIQGSAAVLYVYEEKDGSAEVVMSEFTKKSKASPPNPAQ